MGSHNEKDANRAEGGDRVKARKMRRKALFAAIVAAMLALGFWQSQQTDQQLNRLLAEGFQVDLSIQSNLLLVADRYRQQLVVIYPDRIERLRFDKIIDVEIDTLSGDKQGTNPGLSITLQGWTDPTLYLAGRNEQETRRWQQQLLGLLSEAP